MHKKVNLSNSLLMAWFGKQFLGQGSHLTVSEVAGTVGYKVLTWNIFTVSADLLKLCSVYSVWTEFLLDQVSWAGALCHVWAVVPQSAHHVLGIICLE